MSTLLRSHSSSSSIPFLWEHQPGISKPIHDQTSKSSSSTTPPSLPPPPRSTTADSSSSLARHTIYVPLPPCPFAPTHELAASARKGMRKMDDHDDPFFAAFKECTKCDKKEGKKRKSVKEKVMEMRLKFSCKYDIGVRKDVMIRVHGRDV